MPYNGGWWLWNVRRRRRDLRNFFTFDGVDCRDYGVYISGPGTFSAPARAYDFVSVPGRNGDLIGNNNRLENTELTYPGFAYANFKETIRGFRSFLLSRIGYKRLTDTYHPDEFRFAAYAGPFEPDMLQNLKAGTFDVVFNCKPQRYLLSGETVHTFISTGNLFNPTMFDSKPLIRAFGSGTIGIGDEYITIASNSLPYIDIDCELMDAYNGATNCNSYVTMSENDFPTLPPGETGLTLSGITKIEIKPRWWQL